ncbi:MAG: hypothetical protein GTO24_14700 [candidate division Zixibacteria bacterium]|nr:hypothetical protein [candidate division Zixibacteria bacterium]
MCHLVLLSPVLALPIFWILPSGAAFPFYLVIVGLSGIVYIKILRAMRVEAQAGLEAMLGREGLVIEEINPVGKVEYANEIWEARSTGTRYSKGERIKITGFQGLKLLVEAVPRERD